MSCCRTMADLVGKEVFKRLLGARVYTQGGDCIGYLKRVYVEKRSGKANKLVIKLLGGDLLIVDPRDALVDPEGKIVLLSKVPGGGVREKDFVLKLERLERLVADLRGLKERLLELDEALIAGDISRDTYQRFRIVLERKRQRLLMDVKELVEELEPYVVKLEEEREALLQQVRKEGGDGRGDVLSKLRELRARLARVYEVMDGALYELRTEMELEEFIERYLRAS